MLEADQFYLCENFTAMLARRVSEIMCKQVSVSLPLTGDSHDDELDDYA